MIPQGGDANEAFSGGGVISLGNREQGIGNSRQWAVSSGKCTAGSGPCSLFPVAVSLSPVPSFLFTIPWSLLPIPYLLVQHESVTFRIVGENLAVSTPIQGSLDLLLGFLFGQVLLQEATEEF